jgi:hypothetical protein
MELAKQNPSSQNLLYQNLLRGNRCELTVVEASGKDGALGIFTALAPDIHWRVSLKIDCTADPLQPSVTVSGNHDLYPAYEIIVQQSDATYKDTHRHMPASNVYPGPISLSGSPGITFNNTSTIGQ